MGDEMTSTTMRTRGRLGALALSGTLFGLLGGAPVHAGATPAPDLGATTTTTEPATENADASVPADPTSPDPVAPIAPIAQVAVPTNFSLPLFGVGLTVDITTGPGGSLASVTLNPADGFTATTARPNKVSFVNEDGTAKVVVKARDGGQRVEARAGSLAEIVGPGGWSGELFPGVPGSVAFDVVDDGGVPGIVIGAVTGPNPEVGEIDVAVGGEGDDEVRSSASVKIRFSQDGQSRWLSIKAEVETEHDDAGEGEAETHAKIRITLSKIKTSFNGTDAIGPHTWTGVLCDGTPASIEYTIGDGGAITVDHVDPIADRQLAEGNGVEVRFPGGERVRIRVRTADGESSVKVSEKIRCTDAPSPTLNVPVAPADDSDHDDHDGHDGHDGHDEHDEHEGRNPGNRGNGGDRDRDDRGKNDGGHGDDTTTTVSTQPSGSDA
jgi:hypothetical protein